MPKLKVRFENGKKFIDNPSSEFPQLDAPQGATSAPKPAKAKVPAPPRIRTVGSRAALYNTGKATNRNPVAKPQGDWRGAQDFE